MTAEKIIKALSEGKVPTMEELAFLINEKEKDALLFQAADSICQREFNRQVQIRAILEFSSYCKRNCQYCGLQVCNHQLKRYRMSLEAIIKTAIEAWHSGYLTIVLQSGEDQWYTVDKVCEVIEQIKKQTGLAITLSLGERPLQELQQFRKAGADRYLLKQETAEAQLFATLHPDGSLQGRIQCLRDIKQVGLETGSGFMIGLPGQTAEMIAKDILLLKELDCDMAGIGPFIPHPNTPLWNCQPGSTNLTKKAVALTRLVLPKANLPATTALGVLSKEEKNAVFSSGANVVMRKVTPWDFRSKYNIYPANLGEECTVRQGRLQLEEEIRGLGRVPV